MEQARAAGVRGEIAEALELDDLAGARLGERRLGLAAGQQFAAARVDVVERLAGGRTGRRRREQAVVQGDREGAACAADTQCIVDFTLRPSGELPPRLAGS